MEEMECITVSIRIKPHISPKTVSSLQVISKDPPVVAIIDRSQAYHFDHIFTDEASQEQIYNETVKPLVDYVKKGFSATVFVYGQTGTGKTYTMGTASKSFLDHSYNGIIPRALEQMFMEDDCNNPKDILISFLEIYNEKVFDLLQPNRKSPLPVSGFTVQDMEVKHSEDVNTALCLLELGNKNRHIAETKQNISSSRSHAIFTIHFQTRNSNKVVTGKLNLVDLAGLESVKKTGNIGNTFYEGININKGLLSIGQVISALSMKSGYIPYRQSMITSILQGSLNTENYISLIACVSSSIDDVTETLQTLDFSQRVKKICINPEVNQIITKCQREYANETPLKRLKPTPRTKKIALHSKPLVYLNERNQQSMRQISLPASTKAVRSNTTQEMLSPVIRKYIKEMEESIMERLQTVHRNTVEKTTTKIQDEILKLVRSEINGLTVRATSSPIEYNEAAKIKRVLNYDSSENISPLSLLSEEAKQNDCHNFKVPELLQPKKKNQRKSVLSKNVDIRLRRSVKQYISPNKDIIVEKLIDLPDKLNGSCNISKTEDTYLENEITKFKPRRSMRLAKNKMDNTFRDDFESSINNSNISVNTNNISRNTRSVKLPFKEKVSNDNIPLVKKSVEKITKKSSGRTLKKSKPSCINKKFESKNVKVPIKVLTTESHAGDAYTSHLNKILDILNHGDLKQLERLQSVGLKTAEKIMIYRQLRGNFNEIADISKVPGWGAKKFEKFMVENMLK